MIDNNDSGLARDRDATVGIGSLAILALIAVGGLYVMCGESAEERDARLEAEAEAARLRVEGQERRERFARAKDSLDFSLAKPYEVLDVSEIPVLGVPYDVYGYRVWIHSQEARTREERAQTVLKLAMEFQVEKAAWWVSVLLQPDSAGKELPVANAQYSARGMAEFGDAQEFFWLVKVSDPPRALNLIEYWRLDY